MTPPRFRVWNTKHKAMMTALLSSNGRIYDPAINLGYKDITKDVVFMGASPFLTPDGTPIFEYDLLQWGEKHWLVKFEEQINSWCIKDMKYFENQEPPPEAVLFLDEVWAKEGAGITVAGNFYESKELVIKLTDPKLWEKHYGKFARRNN